MKVAKILSVSPDQDNPNMARVELSCSVCEGPEWVYLDDADVRDLHDAKPSISSVPVTVVLFLQKRGGRVARSRPPAARRNERHVA